MHTTPTHLRGHALSVSVRVLLMMTAILAIRFIVKYALPYLALNETQFVVGGYHLAFTAQGPRPVYSVGLSGLATA